MTPHSLSRGSQPVKDNEQNKNDNHRFGRNSPAL
jgi:hypothetical protein